MTAIAMFALSVAYLVYVLFGYPMLLGWLARRFARPVRRDEQPRPVSFIIAVRDGERWIERKLRSIVSLRYPKELMEIIVASDGSTDRTEEIARAFPVHPVRVLSLPPAGKGAALNAAIGAATNDILVLTDVRQDLEPGSLAILTSFYADPIVGAVSGELRIRSGSSQEEEHIGLYRRYENWIRSQLSAVDSIFGATGGNPCRRRKNAARMPGNFAVRAMASSRSGTSSNCSPAMAPRAETPVRRASIGAAAAGRSRITSITCAGSGRCSPNVCCS